MRLLSSLTISLFLISCGSTGLYVDSDERAWMDKSPPSESESIYKVYLIGDAGAPKTYDDPTLTLFSKHLEKASKNSAAIFLGDNIYGNGLPDSTHPERLFYENRLLTQLKTVKEFFW